MRVIAGSARRLILKAPHGLDVRPTIDRFKETIFNTIQHDIYNAEFLDIFSGTGAIAIEALSRGAKRAVLIEQNVKAQHCIVENLEHTKLIDKSEILKYDYSRALQILESRASKFDIIYMDPPYNKGYEAKAIILIDALKLLKPGGQLICESDAETSFDFVSTLDYMYMEKEKTYKKTKFSYFKVKQ